MAADSMLSKRPVLRITVFQFSSISSFHPMLLYIFVSEKWMCDWFLLKKSLKNFMEIPEIRIQTWLWNAQDFSKLTNVLTNVSDIKIVWFACNVVLRIFEAIQV